MGTIASTVGAKGKFDISSSRMSKNFKEILNSFGISDEVIDNELARNFLNKDQATSQKTSEKNQSKDISNQIVEVEFPKNTFQLSDFPDDYIWKMVAIEYLKSRGFDQNSHKYFLSLDKKYENRLIIPYYRKSKLVYWQARLFDDTEKKQRYLNAPVDKAGIIFNYDSIFDFTDKPIIITEGVFDALHVNGVSIVGSDLSNFHINTFNKSKRDKVFVIDKDIKGYKLGKKALDHGYSITWLDGQVKDINDSVLQLGKLWTIQNIIKNISSGLYAKVWLENMIKGEKIEFRKTKTTN